MGFSKSIKKLAKRVDKTVPGLRSLRQTANIRDFGSLAKSVPFGFTRAAIKAYPKIASKLPFSPTLIPGPIGLGATAIEAGLAAKRGEIPNIKAAAKLIGAVVPAGKALQMGGRVGQLAWRGYQAYKAAKPILKATGAVALASGFIKKLGGRAPSFDPEAGYGDWIDPDRVVTQQERNLVSAKWRAYGAPTGGRKMAGRMPWGGSPRRRRRGRGISMREYGQILLMKQLLGARHPAVTMYAFRAIGGRM